jgi:hypothetical protein
MVVWMDGRGRSLLSPSLGIGNNTTNPATVSTTTPATCHTSGNNSSHGCRLDLRHYGSITLRDLDHLPSNLVSLFIGPYFATRSISQVIDKIPKEQLEYLDLDISTWMLNNNDHTNPDDEEKEEDDSLQMAVNMQILLTQIPHLVHLGLHVHPNPFVVPALAHFLPKKTQTPLKTLDISGCHMDESNLRMLLDAVTLQQTSSSSSSNGITTLRLCDNHITDAGCHIIAHYLRNPHCALEILDLSYNDRIGVDGAMVIFDALRTNPSLRQISFLRCRLLTLAPIQQHQHHHHHHQQHNAIDRRVLLETLLDVFEASSNRVLEYCAGIWTSTGDSSVMQMADNNRVDEDHHFQKLQQLISYELALNRCGRGRILGAAGGGSGLPDSAWPYFFVRLPEDRPACLFYFLRQTVPVWRFGEQGVT